MQMDAQKLEFPENCFDVVISRNLTWNLEKPKQAYREWYRVLDEGGTLLNFDANWYAYLYDEEQRERLTNRIGRMWRTGSWTIIICVRILTVWSRLRIRCRMSARKRPQWDVKVLEEIGFNAIQTDTQIWESVWSEEERLNYQSTPMFMIAAKKPIVHR